MSRNPLVAVRGIETVLPRQACFRWAPRGNPLVAVRGIEARYSLDERYSNRNRVEILL